MSSADTSSARTSLSEFSSRPHAVQVATRSAKSASATCSGSLARASCGIASLAARRTCGTQSLSRRAANAKKNALGTGPASVRSARSRTKPSPLARSSHERNRLDGSCLFGALNERSANQPLPFFADGICANASSSRTTCSQRPRLDSGSAPATDKSGRLAVTASCESIDETERRTAARKSSSTLEIDGRTVEGPLMADSRHASSG